MKIILRKYFFNALSLMLLIIYPVSSFNYEVLNLCHELLHYLSHETEIFHNHDFEDHLADRETSHNHKALSFLVIHNNEDGKDKNHNSNQVTERKDLDSHLVPKLIKYAEQKLVNLLQSIKTPNSLLYCIITPITPPPQNISL
jgi:hypothetical protein